MWQKGQGREWLWLALGSSDGAGGHAGWDPGDSYSPFLSVAWFATKDGAESLENPLVAGWVEPFARIFNPLLTFASPDDVYLTYGKVFLFVGLGFLVGLLALHTRQAPRAGGLEKWGFRVALVGSVLLVVGLIGAFFWVGAVDFSHLAFLVPGQYLRNRGVKGSANVAHKALAAARSQSVSLPAQRR